MLEWKDYGSDWPDLPYPNFIAWLAGMEQKWGSRDSILYRTARQKEFKRWSYRETAEYARRIGRGLIKAGIRKGDRVVLWAENCPQWIFTWLGTIITGAIIVPVDYLVSENECANIIKITKAKAFFYSIRKKEFAASLSSRGLPITVSACIDFPEGEPELDRFGADAADVTLPGEDFLAEHDPVSIVFTSGTTGFAKGVTLHHKGIIANSSAAICMLQSDDKDVFISVLPMHHTYATTCSFISPLIIGAPLVIVDKLVGKVVLDDIHDAGGTILVAVPLLFDKVKQGIEAGYKKLPVPVRMVIDIVRRKALKEANRGNIQFGMRALKFFRKKAGMASLQLLVSGGGPLNPKTADFFNSFGFNLINGYGMSENSPLITVSTPQYKNNVSVGLPVKYTEVKILNPDEEGIGEIAVKSPSIMLGYYENPEATAEVLTGDGWLITGDQGYRDEQGFLYISGRKKNLIVSAGGKNIYPEEIEMHFENSRIIKQVLVVGRKEEESGNEQIFAVIVPDREKLSEHYPVKLPLSGPLTPEMSRFVSTLVKKEVEKVNRVLPGYKKISGFVLREEAFEMNAQQKIRRFLYREYEKPVPRAGA